MREFKFRAWNTWHKKMYLVYSLNFESNLVLCKADDYASHTFGKIDCKIMQATGFKDRFGKDIYEGDVIENKIYGNKYSVQWGEKDWDYAGFVLRNTKTGECSLVLLSDKINLDVVGNIYENPDLLEV